MTENKTEIFSLAISYFMCAVFSLYPLLIWGIVWKKGRERKRIQIEKSESKTLETLFGDFKQEDECSGAYFHLVFLMRRMVVVLCIVFCQSVPYV